MQSTCVIVMAVVMMMRVGYEQKATGNWFTYFHSIMLMGSKRWPLNLNTVPSCSSNLNFYETKHSPLSQLNIHNLKSGEP